MRFAIIGVGGYIAKRHLNAIKILDGTLVAACDLHDSVGILDSYFPNVPFFTSPPKFFEYIKNDVSYLAVCTPNHLHIPHTLAGLFAGANIICEKPLGLDAASARSVPIVAQTFNRKAYAILQLRHHPQVGALKTQLNPDVNYNVHIEYHTYRGPWYYASWKGDSARSGGLACNIGSHLFDLVTWLFGPCKWVEVTTSTPSCIQGQAETQNANVSWNLNLCNPDVVRTMRVTSDTLDTIVDLADQFSDLHIPTYRNILEGSGVEFKDVIDGIEMVDMVNTAIHRIWNSIY